MVTWDNGAIANPPPASDEAVRQAENELRVDLPADFLAVARTHQGASPQPASIDLRDGFVTDVDCLFHFEPSPFTSNILAAGFPFQDVLPKGIIPFARDVGGDVFCFNYRDDYDNPSVVFFGAGFGIVPLAPNFTAFLALLHD